MIDYFRVQGMLWDLFTSKDLPAVGVYTGFIPPGYVCQLLGVELRKLQYPDR